jgi:hypothetical protein
MSNAVCIEQKTRLIQSICGMCWTLFATPLIERLIAGFNPVVCVCVCVSVCVYVRVFIRSRKREKRVTTTRNFCSFSNVIKVRFSDGWPRTLDWISLAELSRPPTKLFLLPPTAEKRIIKRNKNDGVWNRVTWSHVHVNWVHYLYQTKGSCLLFSFQSSQLYFFKREKRVETKRKLAAWR